MAWNDVRTSTNKAIHLLVKIGGRDFNFRQAADIKVERKIGDTLSKFSLGIVDDSGSDQRSNYVEFERYLLNQFTSIEISYGNTWNDLQRFTGFVVDYQPVFFGNSTKLTVTGYITRITNKSSEKYLTSPYSYWYDWTPYVGVRNNSYADWDEIYSEKGITFNDAMKTAATKLGADFTDISSNWAGDVVDDSVMSQINGLITSESKTYNQEKSRYEKSLSDYFSKNSVNSFITDFGLEGNVSYESLKINTDQNKQSTVSIYYRNMDTGKVDNVTVNLNSFVTKYGGNSYESYNSFTLTESAYRKNRNILLNLAKQDAIDAQEAEGTWKGAIPFREEILREYTGNVKFQDLVHVQTGRKLKRVCPDLFVEWDNVVPLTDQDPETMTEEDLKTRMNEFSHHVICDITVFGLRFKVNATRVRDGDIKNAYTLYPQDRWGITRVIKNEQGKYYIWVGDAPDLWKKYEACKDCDYQNQKSDFRWGSSGTKSAFDYKTAKVWSTNTTYAKDDTIYFPYDYGSLYDDKKEYKTAKALCNFKTGDNPEMNVFRNVLDWFVEGTAYHDKKYKGLQKMWEDAKLNKQIQEDGGWTGAEEYDKAMYDVRDYVVYALREKDNELKWINDKSTEERGNIVKGRDARGRQVELTRKYRIKTYLQSAFRSALPLAYGEVRISDIVKQLAYLEKWDDYDITSTTPSDSTASFYFMNGQTALEYISETLGPEAVEAGGGRVGFTTYFDKGKFIFKPASMHYSGSTVYETGYNRKNSDVISFTVRSRGILLMQGVDADISNINAYTNERVAATTTRRGTDMSNTEAKLRQELAVSDYQNIEGFNPYDTFFNLPLYYYYGNSENNLEEYANFVGSLSSDYASIADLPFKSQTMVATNKSSTSSSTDVIQTAIADMDKIRNTCIQAEMTIIGNTALAPGQWITINNYTKRGPHYTSGDYFIQTISDQVTAGGAFTQNLSMYRFSGTVAAMTTGSTHLEAGISILQRYGQTKFESWILNNYPDLAKEYNISSDTLGTTVAGVSPLLTGNENKPFYKVINGVEVWGQGKKIESDATRITYFYTDAGAYVVTTKHYSGNNIDPDTETQEAGYISNYKSYKLKDGDYYDRYGNIVSPLN